MAANMDNLEEVLPKVFDLILFSVDKIVDDTSLEKFLEILDFLYNNPKEDRNVAKPAILEFFSRVRSTHVEACFAPTVSFALRLAGIVCHSSEGFRTLCGVENILQYLFHETVKKNEVWTDPGVRDSYFKAALGILRSNDGFLWIKHSGVLQQAVACLVDNSIFVEHSARKFVAKYLITLYNESSDHSNQMKNDSLAQMENGSQVSAKHDCMVANMSTFAVGLSTCHKHMIRHFKHILEQLPTGLARTMPRQVSVVQLLLSLMEEDSTTAQEILRPLAVVAACFKVLNYVNKGECGRVIDVIFTLLSNTSEWQIGWITLLDLQDKQDLFHTMFEFVMILCKRMFVFHAFQLVQGVFRAGQSLDFDDSGMCLLFMLLSFPVHATLHSMDENNHVGFRNVKDITAELSGNFSTKDGYSVVRGILKEANKDFLTCSTVAQSLIVTTDVIHDMKLPGNSKLTGVMQDWCGNIVEFLNEQSDDYFTGNSLTKLFIKAITVCLNRGFFNSDSAFDGRKECYRLFIKLLYSSQDSKIIGSCFGSLKCLFSKAEGLFPGYVDVATLNQILALHCASACWDVRDSTLGFLRFLLVTFYAGDLELLLDPKLLLLLWKLLQDGESYVRASSVYLLGDLSTHDVIWKDYCETISLSEEEVLNYLVNAFEQEEAAFVRRATIDVLCFWLEQKHNIILKNLDEKKFSAPISRVLKKARQDFDWEVKLCVLNFWETVLHHYADKKTLHSVEDSYLQDLSSVILDAITDCDQPVRERGLAVLQGLKTRLVGLVENDTLFYNGSFDELAHFVLQTRKHNNYSLLQTLLVINFSGLSASFQVLNLVQNPLPFLIDILASASENKDNLLDCY